MNRPEILQYHRDLASLLNSEPNRAQRRAFLVEERKTPEYQTAKKEAITAYSREKQLVENVLAPIFNDLVLKEKAAGCARSIVEEYNGLPKLTVGQIKETKKFIRQAAGELLQNPEDINTAVFVWKRHDLFYELVKEESKTLIREKWEHITPEQLAELVRIYANNPQAKDFAKEMLTSYFNRPKSTRQRVHAYYTFVSSVLDLVGEDKAFNEGVRIGLHDTDILPKDPYLIEHSVFISLPYTIFQNSSNGTKDLLSLPRNKDEERVFQKLLIAKYTILKLSTMGSEDLRILRQKEEDFVNSSDKLQIMWEKEQEKAEKKIGRDKVMRLNNAMNAFADSEDTLSIEMTDEHNWVQNIFRDETDPLNQKFKKVLSKRGLAEKA